MWRYRKMAGWALLAGGFGGRGRPSPAGSVFTADPGSIGAAPLRPRLQRWLQAALERSPRRWMGGDSRPFSERLGTDPPRQSLLFFRFLVAASPPSEAWGYTLIESLPSFSFQLRAPLYCSGTAPAQLSCSRSRSRSRPLEDLGPDTAPFPGCTGPSQTYKMSNNLQRVFLKPTEEKSGNASHW